jgi:hypothetical protein
VFFEFKLRYFYYYVLLKLNIMPVYIDTAYRRVRTLENKASNNHFSMASFSIYTVYIMRNLENNEMSSLDIWTRNRLLSVQYVFVEGMEGVEGRICYTTPLEGL